MKLTWGERLWPARTAGLDGPGAPERDARCDVLIVGAGISGAMTADALVRAGLDVIAIDKRTPGCGSSGASTALLLYELDTPLRELIPLVGEDHSARAYQLGINAIDEIEKLVSELGDDCSFQRKKSVYLASNPEDAAHLQEECQLRRKHGLRVELLHESDIAGRFGFRRPAAILSHEAAEVDPFRLNQLLIRRALTNGLRLFTHTELARYEPTSDGAFARLTNGCAIRAKRLVYATGYEAAPLIGSEFARAQVSYAVASEPLDSFETWWERCLLWETARPYLYLRTTSDGRALIGGEDDPDLRHLGDNERLEKKGEHLRSEFSKLFPRIDFRPAFAWAGVFETTPDGLPYIGAHPRFPRALFGLGYGGNGMTFSMIAAQILRDLVTGRKNEDAEIFGFDRR